MNSLNPVMRVKDQIAEAIETHQGKRSPPNSKSAFSGCWPWWGCPAGSTPCIHMS